MSVSKTDDLGSNPRAPAMAVFKFSKNDSFGRFQHLVGEVYSLPDDQLYSIYDLLAHQQRFAMRALKGIRKGDHEKLKINLLIAFSWLMAIANRFHIDVDDAVWQRFPMLCSYCSKKPCACKKIKPTSRRKLVIVKNARPPTLAGFQEMFMAIYPPSRRTLSDAGIHLAEEMGEVSEAVHNFLGQHRSGQLQSIKQEIADFVSCVFGIANSARINIAAELAKMFSHNCHVCHKAPCVCSFSKVARLRT